MMMMLLYAILCGLQLLGFVRAALGLIVFILVIYLKENEQVPFVTRFILVGIIQAVVFTAILVALYPEPLI